MAVDAKADCNTAGDTRADAADEEDVIELSTILAK